MPLSQLRDTLGRYAALLRLALLPGPTAIPGRTARHYLLAVLVLAGLPLLLAYHWLGLLLDEILFRGYRRVAVEEPVFIVGVPRSGTTALHHTLAADEQFTTFRTWECLFATSVTWRRFWWAAVAVDRRVGRPLGRLAGWAGRHAFRGLDDVHPMDLNTPEEDHFVFLPLLYCFILVVAFPDAAWLWRFGRFDERMTAGERAKLMTYYRRCVQRHLYAHGADKRFLAKNPTFSPLVASLAQAFPDARFLCCLREPREAVSSQLSVLDRPLRTLHGRYDEPAFQARMCEQLSFYYRHLLDTLCGLYPGRAVLIPAPALRGRLDIAVRTAYGALGLPLHERFAERLAFLDAEARESRSAHRHRLSDFTVDPILLRQRLADVYNRFDFHGIQVVPAAAWPSPARKRGTA